MTQSNPGPENVPGGNDQNDYGDDPRGPAPGGAERALPVPSGAAGRIGELPTPTMFLGIRQVKGEEQSRRFVPSLPKPGWTGPAIPSPAPPRFVVAPVPGAADATDEDEMEI